MKENLDNIETIQSCGAEKRSIDNITNRIQTIETAQIKSQRVYALMIGFAWSLTALGIAVTWWFGGHQVISNDITLGQLVMFSGFLLFAYEPVRYFTRNVRDYRRSIIALKHIQELLELPSSINEDNKLKPLNITNGSIQLQDIFFSPAEVNNSASRTNNISILTPYHYTKEQFTKYTLKDICFKIEPKSITAIVGKSGSGKSSILRLIMRLYEPISGRILIDNQDIKYRSLSSLREQIAMVPQSPAVFSGTIMENICLSNPHATKQEVEEICNSIDASSFINKFDKGLDTIVGQRGIHLSGGESQKIGLARALLKRPKILLLDEPMSSVDSHSAEMIKKKLLELKKIMSIVIIDHTANSVDFVDNLVTIHNGMVRYSRSLKAVKEFENGAFIEYSKDKLAYQMVEQSDNTNSNKTKIFRRIVLNCPYCKLDGSEKFGRFQDNRKKHGRQKDGCSVYR